VLAVARSHGLLDVLDPNYVPTTEKEQELLTLKNNFMFAVWATKLLTPASKRSVRRHRATGNAQAVWTEIRNDALKTTRASLQCDTIHSFLTSNKFSDRSWKSSARNYLIYWENQADLFNQMQSDPMGRLNDYQMLRLLKNAVSLAPTLHSVQLTDNFDQQRGRLPLGYEQYKDLLYAAADNLDSLKPPSRDTPRKVHKAELNHADEYHDPEVDETAEEVDSNPIDTILANVAKQGSFRPSMKRDV
jgi:hypothetical protein